jgi:DHA2 family multidrug resistance protein
VTPDAATTRIALDHLANLGYSLAQSYQFLERQINTQAYMLAANDLFWGSAVLFLLLIAVIWLARPARTQGSVDAGGAH